MKITNFGLGQAAPPSRSQVDGAASTSAAEQNSNAPARGYTPSPELLQLIDHLHAEPEVREDRIQAVASKLRDGSYRTPASAQATAAAILSGRND